jgi:hypothetical protein
MKRLLTAVLITATAAMAVILTGCDRIALLSPENIDLNKAYAFSANMQFNSAGTEFAAAAQFERKSEGTWYVTFTEPFALAGLEMSYYDGNLTSRFEGVEFTAVAGSDAVVMQIIHSFENAVNGEGREITVGGRGVEEIRITSKAGQRGNSYELVLDKRTLQPLTLSVPETSLSVSFAQVQVSQIAQVILPGGENAPDNSGENATENSGENSGETGAEAGAAVTRSQWEEDLRIDS